jgi:hypothetical protein
MIFLLTKQKDNMFKHPAILLGYFKYSILPGIIASVPMFFFLKDSRFSQTWLLYLGDALFLVCMIVTMYLLNKKSNEDVATGSLLLVGHVITIFSVLIICFIAFILLLIFVPDLFSSNSGRALTNTPASMIHGNTNGLVFIVFMNSVFGTTSAGSFVSIMLPYTMKREQRGDRAEV